MSEPLESWIERQQTAALHGMLQSISRVDIVKERAGFGQRVRPARGGIVASPILASYDPDPDYFFHWLRDSALVMDALRLLLSDSALRAMALSHFQDFVQFSHALGQLDGRSLIRDRRWRAAVGAEFQRFVREDAELALVHGEAISGETRVNPDATLDISKWGRPQHDGPALRALTLLRWEASGALESPLQEPLAGLLRADLAYALAHGGQPCVDIWEEEHALHYYTVCVSAAALEQGARWLAAAGANAAADACVAEAQRLQQRLDEFWLESQQCYCSRRLPSGAQPAKGLDIAMILAAIHADTGGARHSPRDPRLHATLAGLEALFEADYPINQNRPPELGPAMGRYHGDVYYSGGAYYFATLGAAEFCFRAAAYEQTPAQVATWIERGEAYLRTVQRYTPASGEMSEQFDQRTGLPSSAKQLSWSYAAFISCAGARRRCLATARQPQFGAVTGAPLVRARPRGLSPGSS